MKKFQFFTLKYTKIKKIIILIINDRYVHLINCFKNNVLIIEKPGIILFLPNQYVNNTYYDVILISWFSNLSILCYLRIS